MSGKHEPNSWDDYLRVHDSRLADYSDHFITENRLEYSITGNRVVWDGALICLDGIEIHARKSQRLSMRGGRAWVQTTDYSYQVLQRRGADVVQLFRYDNSAHHSHPDPHHRHRYDGSGKEMLPVEHVGEEGWPTLGEVIEEAFDTWRSSRQA